MIKTRPSVVEPKSTLKSELSSPSSLRVPSSPIHAVTVIIHDDTSLPLSIQLHPPAFNALTPLPPPRFLRPSAISHSSPSNGSLLSVYSYSVPSAQMEKGAGLSIEFGEEEEGEVHVEREVRKWLSVEGAEVLLRVKGEEGQWLLVER